LRQEELQKEQQSQEQAYSLIDVAIDFAIENVDALIDYIPGKQEIVKELARRKKPFADAYEKLDAIEYLIENNKIKLDILEIVKNYFSKNKKSETLPFPYNALLSTGLFLLSKYKKELSTMSFEQFKNEVLKTKYYNFAVRYPEILRSIYNFLRSF